MPSLEISPEQFLHLSKVVADLAAQYLASLDSRSIAPANSGTEVQRLFREDFPEDGIGEQSLDKLADVIANCRVQNARFFGYVLGSGEPVGAVADLLASVLNQNVTAWRSGPAAVTLEHNVVEWLGRSIGCAGFRGSLTGGGSMANLMGLAMAREAKMPANENGLTNGRQPVIYASSEIHMSIPKSVAMLGIGRNNLRRIAVDQNFRMIPEKLEAAIESDLGAGGVLPIAIVASAGTVNTGSIDPLPAIAAIAKKYDLWFHVDGAYGALAAIAAPEKFVGIDLVDSVSLDPHKWLYQSLDCGCLLYRDSALARKAFSYTGDYAKSLTDDPVEGYAFFDESMELSRRFRALKLWLSLRYHGFRAFRGAIQANLDLAQRLAAKVSQEPKLEILAPVELSAVCFRYRPDPGLNEADLNSCNARILRRILERGRVYISNAALGGRFCLRACIVNHRTTEADVDAVITEVQAAAKDLHL